MNDLLNNSFQPLDAARCTQVEDRVCYFYIKHNVRDAYVSMLLRQMKYNDTKRHETETWAVVGSEQEAALLLNDLVEGNVTGRRLEHDRVSLFARYNASTHSLCIMTYQELVLSKLLEARRADWTLGPRDNRDVILLMDFGCGEVTWTMAVSVMGVMRLATAHGSDTRRPQIVACTVSNTPESPWGDMAKARRITIEPPEGRWWQSNRRVSFRDEAKVEQLDLSDRLDELNEETTNGRMVLFLDPATSLDTTQDFKNRRSRVVPDIDVATIIDLRKQGPRHILWHSHFIQTGPVAEVSGIFVDREKSAWVYDKGRTQVVLGRTPRSRAEIRLVEDIKTPNAVVPDLYYAMSKAELEALPEVPQQPPAWTNDYMKTLLSCIDWCPGCPVKDMPIRLPEYRVVEEYLRRLERQQLIEFQAPLERYEHRAYGTWKLTAYGSKVVDILLSAVVQDFHVACLLGRLLCAESSVSTNLIKSPAIDDAITMLAAVLEPSRVTNRTIFFQTIKLQKDVSSGFLAQVVGIAQPFIRRGPIWMAVAVWQKLRTDFNWRVSPLEAFQAIRCESKYVVDNVVIERLQSFHWDDIFTSINHALPQIGPSLRPDSRLTNDERLAVDRSLVWAFLDKILVVFIDTDDGEPLIVDLVSRMKVSEAHPMQSRQLDMEGCQELETLPTGERPPFIFCIHTHLVCEKDEGGQFWTAYDVTHVSIAAVQQVLRCVSGNGPIREILNGVRTGLHTYRQ